VASKEGEEGVRVVVFGAGAVGLGLASALLADGQRVALVARPETADALRRHGLHRSGIFGTAMAPPGSFPVACRLADLPQAAADFVLVATKAFDSAEAAAALAEASAQPKGIVGGQTRIVLCQNGWGSAEPFLRHFSEAQVWNGRVITGFRRPEPHHVEVTVHAEPIHLGSLFGEEVAAVLPLCDALDRGGLPAAPSPDVAADLWAKMLYNGCLNPLGAVFGVPYGALAESAPSRAIMADLAREMFAVLAAAGLHTHWPDADAFLADFHTRLLPPTASHESSMLQDLRAGKRTEIDALTGAVVRLAEAHGVDVPVHRTVLRLVRFLEERGSAHLPG
jgi:2-dehydropantoate 2-reductase